MTTINEEQMRSPDELLDWLCWSFATSAERFYPPVETANECMDALADERYDDGSLEEAKAYAMERGQHARALMEADDFFRSLEKHGYGPKARAERHVEEAREEGLDLDNIDWTWYEHARGGGDEAQ